MSDGACPICDDCEEVIKKEARAEAFEEAAATIDRILDVPADPHHQAIAMRAYASLLRDKAKEARGE